MTIAALAVITVVSVLLYLHGRRYTRTYVAKHRKMPPLTWMFRRTDDPDLEGPRRLALGLLPIYLIALALYLFRPA